MSSSVPDVVAPPRPRSRWRDVAIVAGVAIAFHLPGLVLRVFNRDEATIATVASAMVGGDALYTGTTDRKPPLVFLFYQAVFRVTGSTDLRLVRLVALGGVVAAAVALGREAHRRRPEVPVVTVAALFLLAVVAFPPEDAQAAGFELLSLLPITLAFVASARTDDPRAAWKAGAWLGIAILCKQSSITVAPAIAWNLWRARPHARIDWRRAAISVGIAGTITVAVLLVPVLFYDRGNYFSWVFTGQDSYLAFDSITSVGWRAIVATLLVVSSQIGVLAGIYVVARKRALDTDVVVWLACAGVGATIGLRFFGHYFLPIVPPLVLLAAPALSSSVNVRRVVFAGALATATIWTAVAFHPQLVNTLPAYQGAASRIDELTAPGDRIFVWGQMPQLYWAADRLPASRFPHVGFLTGITGGRDGEVPYANVDAELWSELFHDFDAHPPALIADAAAVAVPDGSRYPLSSSPLGSYVSTNYCAAGTRDGVTLFVRRDRPDASRICASP